MVNSNEVPLMFQAQIKGRGQIKFGALSVLSINYIS